MVDVAGPPAPALGEQHDRQPPLLGELQQRGRSCGGSANPGCRPAPCSRRTAPCSARRSASKSSPLTVPMPEHDAVGRACCGSGRRRCAGERCAATAKAAVLDEAAGDRPGRRCSRARCAGPVPAAAARPQPGGVSSSSSRCRSRTSARSARIASRSSLAGARPRASADVAGLDEQHERLTLEEGLARHGADQRARAPATGASTMCCIFIASSTATGWPAWTASPARTSIDTTVPCIGAASGDGAVRGLLWAASARGLRRARRRRARRRSTSSRCASRPCAGSRRRVPRRSACRTRWAAPPGASAAPCSSVLLVATPTMPNSLSARSAFASSRARSPAGDVHDQLRQQRVVVAGWWCSRRSRRCRRARRGRTAGRSAASMPPEGAALPSAGMVSMLMRSCTARPRGAGMRCWSSPSSAQRLARGDAQLRLHQVDAGHHLGHRVLDLQPRVRLDEGEGDVASGPPRRPGTRRCRGRGSARPRPGAPRLRAAARAARGASERARRELDQLLVAPLQRCSRAPTGARPRRCRRRSPAPRCDGRARSAARRRRRRRRRPPAPRHAHRANASSTASARRTMRMPRPPPPATALIIIAPPGAQRRRGTPAPRRASTGAWCRRPPGRRARSRQRAGLRPCRRTGRAPRAQARRR